MTKFQEDTNKIQKNRIDVLEGRIADLEKQNIVQQHIIDTITSALKQKGMVVTVDGDMVTIADKSGATIHHKRRTITTQQTASITKKEED